MYHIYIIVMVYMTEYVTKSYVTEIVEHMVTTYHFI